MMQSKQILIDMLSMDPAAVDVARIPPEKKPIYLHFVVAGYIYNCNKTKGYRLTSEGRAEAQRLISVS